MPEVTVEQKERSRLSKEEWREFTKTVWHIANVSDDQHPAVFPPEIPRRLIKLFSFCDEVVLDPFAGVGTTAKVALEEGRRAICVEQEPGYVERIWSDCAGSATDGQLDVRLGDSRSLSGIGDDSVGLALTSPPYWNKADYGDGHENLGSIGSYSAFIRALRPAFEEVYRVLVPGRKFAVVTANVNQHTEYGLLTFPLATDIVLLLREVGFLMINEIIWSKDGTGGRWGSSGKQRPIFGSYPYPPNFLFKNVHEYVIVVAKPPTRRANGKTVLPYAELMDTTAADGNGIAANRH